MTACLLALALWSAQAGQVAPSPDSAMALTLDDAVRMALARSYQLQRSERSERIASERINSARAALGPHLDLSIGADQTQRYYDFRGAYDYSVATPQFSATAGINAYYDFDISGARKRSFEQSRLSGRSGAVDVELTALNVAIDARLSYIQALRAQQQMEIDREYLLLLEKLIAGAATRQPSVVDFLETERSNAALVLDQSKQGAQLALSSLRQQLRMETNQAVRLTTTLTDAAPVPPVTRLVELAYANRSDIRQSGIRLRQAKIAQSQATDFRRPSLRVSAFASHSLTGEALVHRWSDIGRSNSAGVALSFNLPIWSYDGGELSAARHIAAIQAEQALADAEEAKERARNEIAAEMIGIDRARSRIEQTPDAMQARQALQRAEEAMLSASPKDAPGLLAQVSNARQNWRSSVTLKYDALAAFYGEYFRLQRTLGTDAMK